MQFTNYTVADTIRIAVAFVLFAPCLVCPGYVLGACSDVLQFRARSLAEKVLIAVPLSVSAVPLLIYLTGLLSIRVTWAALGIIAISFVALFARDIRRRRGSARWAGAFLAMMACWLTIGLVSLVDYHWGDRLYIPTTSWDYLLRVSITDAISRTGVAPANPFYFPGFTSPLRYHYFWMLPASIVDQLGGDFITPTQAVIAGTLWSGVSLMALVVLYVFYFQGAGRERSAKRALIGVALLAVTGLDIIPMLFHLLMFNHIPFTVDSWNDLIAGWASSVLWVPHHVAAMVACMTGFLVLWTGSGRPAVVRIVSAVVAGTAFACTVGLSIYVCLVFAAALLVFGVVAVLKWWRNDVVGVVVSGVTTIILALPFLSRLATASAEGGSFIKFTVREFSFPDNLLAFFHASKLLVYTVNLTLLPVNYGMELGLFFLVGIVHVGRLARRKKALGRREWAEVALIGTPVFICTFLRSGVITQNDLGWRGFLIPQFMLLLWSIDYLRIAARGNIVSSDTLSPLRRFSSLVVLATGLGLSSTLYGLVIGRAFFPVLEAGWLRQEGSWFWTPDLNIGRRMLGQRDADEWIQTRVPHEAVVLANPLMEDVEFGLYVNHQTVAPDEGCGAVFGGSSEICGKVLADVRPLFSAGTSQVDLDSICRRYSVRAILVKDIDPVWRNPRSWVWEREPAYANRFARVFLCGP